MRNLPLCNVSFTEIRKENKIYVDKTDMIASIARANANKAFF